MKIQIRSDRVHISGYVNAVERWSRPLTDKDGKRFIEKIAAGAFRRALEEAPRVGVMLNHERTLTDTQSDAVRLEEDSIGLRFDGDIFDPEVIAEAKQKQLRGWSFGFRPGTELKATTDQPGVDYTRTLESLDLLEVSIIDQRKLPAYPATSVEVRDGGEIELRVAETENVEVEEDGDVNDELRTEPGELPPQEEAQAMPDVEMMRKRLRLRSI